MPQQFELVSYVSSWNWEKFERLKALETIYPLLKYSLKSNQENNKNI